MLDSFAIYHSWLFVGEEEFAAVHQAAGQRIVLFFVVPTFILTVVTIIMFWHRPAGIPRRLIWLAFAFQMVSWLSSALIQIPIQAQLSQGKDDELLNKLITTDWIRIVAMLAYVIVVFRIIRRLQTYHLQRLPARALSH